jgi:flagellin-like protein
MNVFGKRERSWRKARKRGVSPIIATILLVAITVVLAAVLYVLISGLTHGAGSVPLGTDISWGSPNNVSGTAPLGCAAAAGHWCYSIEIAGTGGGVSTSNIQLALRSALGATVAWPASLVTISLETPSSGAAVATYAPATTTWTLVSPFTGTLAGGDTIVIYMTSASLGTGVQTGLLATQLVAIGINGFSGTVPSNSFS